MRSRGRLLLILLLLSGIGLFTVGRERINAWIAGPADQGAVDFSTLQRRTRPTDSLACSPDLCRIRVDLALPAYAEPPAALMQRLDRLVLADTVHLVRVDDGSRPDYRRYVARSAAFRFADTIDAEARVTAAGTGLAIYGRSQIGIGDWGVNRARQQGWAAGLLPFAVSESAPPTS